MKGQVSLEFTVITTIALVLFSTGFIVAEQQFIKAQNVRLDQGATDMLSVIETEIVIANKAGEGYNRVFKIPQRLENEPYNVQLNTYPTGKDELVLEIAGKQYFLFLTEDIDGTITQGENNITVDATGIKVEPVMTGSYTAEVNNLYGSKQLLTIKWMWNSPTEIFDGYDIQIQEDSLPRSSAIQLSQSVNFYEYSIPVIDPGNKYTLYIWPTLGSEDGIEQSYSININIGGGT